MLPLLLPSLNSLHERTAPIRAPPKGKKHMQSLDSDDDEDDDDVPPTVAPGGPAQDGAPGTSADPGASGGEPGQSGKKKSQSNYPEMRQRSENDREKDVKGRIKSASDELDRTRFELQQMQQAMEKAGEFLAEQEKLQVMDAQIVDLDTKTDEAVEAARERQASVDAARERLMDTMKSKRDLEFARDNYQTELARINNELRRAQEAAVKEYKKRYDRIGELRSLKSDLVKQIEAAEKRLLQLADTGTASEELQAELAQWRETMEAADQEERNIDEEIHDRTKGKEAAGGKKRQRGESDSAAAKKKTSDVAKKVSEEVQARKRSEEVDMAEMEKRKRELEEATQKLARQQEEFAQLQRDIEDRKVQRQQEEEEETRRELARRLDELKDNIRNAQEAYDNAKKAAESATAKYNAALEAKEKGETALAAAAKRLADLQAALVGLQMEIDGGTAEADAQYEDTLDEIAQIAVSQCQGFLDDMIASLAKAVNHLKKSLSAAELFLQTCKENDTELYNRRVETVLKMRENAINMLKAFRVSELTGGITDDDLRESLLREVTAKTPSEKAAAVEKLLAQLKGLSADAPADA